MMVKEEPKKKRKRRGGSSKGNPFEREICVRFSEWWTNDRRVDVFYRTAGSGGRATNRAKRNRQTANSHGDLAALDSAGEPFLRAFAVEIKRGYSGVTVADLLDARPHHRQQTWDAWIQQARASQQGAGAKSWLIIARRDQREAVVCLETSVLLRLFAAENLTPSLGFAGLLKDGSPVAVTLMPLEAFLDRLTPNMVREFTET